MVDSLVDLSKNTKLRLSGADRLRYLNGQVTNDVAKATADKAVAACITTAKGKMNAFIFITQSPETDAFLIETLPELRESLAMRLDRYIIADDCELTDVSDDFDLVHLIGDTPPAVGHAVRNDDRFGLPGYDVWLAPGTEKPPGHILSEEEIIALCVKNQIPRWGTELTEDTLPAEAHLDKYAIDFHKGCYIGQEVISRIKSVGRVNRVLVSMRANAPLSEGMALHSTDGKEIGKITTASGNQAIGYVKRDFSDSGTQLSARNLEKELSTDCEIIQTPKA